jgi:hypothetical protein
MRYRIVIEQVMTRWYATVTTWEPDGHTLQKDVRHYTFDVSEEYPGNLGIILSRLERQVSGSAL